MIGGVLLACACTVPAFAGPGAHAPRPTRSGPPMGNTMILGGGLMLSGAGLGLIALVRSRHTDTD